MNMCSYNCESISTTLKILSEENRLRILCILQKGECCVCELIEQNNLSQSLISHHLKDLKDSGMVSSRKSGLRVYYSLTEKGKQITNLIFKI